MKPGKIGKKSKIIFQQPKTLENSNNNDIRSAIIKHPKTFHKLSKAIMQVEKDSQESGTGKNYTNPLYDKKKVNIFGSKKCKNSKTIICL